MLGDRFSSLVFADSLLKFHFLFTRDSYNGFLLRHDSFSYVLLVTDTIQVRRITNSIFLRKIHFIEK